MCVRKNSLYASLPLPSIPTALPPSPRTEKVHAFSDCHIYEYDFSKISNNYNGFTTSENALTFTIPAYKDKRSAARDGDNGVSEFLMTATVLQHLRLHLRLLSPHTGKVPAQPGIGVSLSRPGTSNSIENR